MTHHLRPDFTLGETSFRFVDGEPAEVLARAKAAAQGRDVRLGGGATTIRAFLDADLVDTLHVAVAPVELGSGGRLWESPQELLDRFHLEVVPEPEWRHPPHLLASLSRPAPRPRRVVRDDAGRV